MGYADIFQQAKSAQEPEDKEERGNNEPSAALIANSDKRGGCIVHCKPGCLLYYEVHEIGTVELGDYGLDDAPPGISVWEGAASWTPGGYENPTDGTMNYDGKFRRLTDEELKKVQRGECLWPPLDKYPGEDDDEDEGA